ncbi:hypothetical protein COK00_21810 [Bacillus cereus]|uniref:DUF6445 family protein n=1 Tax=Bacillus cereus TaxID=1396 RepID=UPI000BED979B|nr:DUF6445 family protein [Bacillus cereus]PEC87372.1 hypothetical protein CON28_00105 [Bacillus cereus]PEX40072.1 hypothetical protein CN455_04600 [Bacillus cereus]PFB16563.1 hypothetical protein CN399_11065 [Bacillus cereus]PFB67465.1 hypothetical protein CN291_10920 [Bacillus cereus]PFM38879.1 hypothetical protein COJ47_00535 [Bacillus cereus]
MEKDIIVIDDFYKEPNKVRNLALNVHGWIDENLQGEKKPSIETEKNYYTNEIINKFESILGFNIDVNPKKMGFGVFAFYPEYSRVDQTTHFDDTDWSGIIYLVPDNLCKGGLSLYRHKPTGLTGPPNINELQELGYSSMKSWYEDYLNWKLSPEDWEETMHLDMKYNRLVLFKSGALFHRASSGFGDSPSNGRLTQRFFFNRKVGVLDAK